MKNSLPSKRQKKSGDASLKMHAEKYNGRLTKKTDSYPKKSRK